MSGEILYSHREDEWLSCDESIEEVATMAWDDMTDLERPDDRVIELYKGIKTLQTLSNFLDVESILDNIGESAYDNLGDVAEDYLRDVSEVQMSELEKLIQGWADKHQLNPEFFSIENIEPVKFTVPADWD